MQHFSCSSLQTFDSTQPEVSVHIDYLKEKHYGSQYTRHRFCLSVKQYSLCSMRLLDGLHATSGHPGPSEITGCP